MVFLCREIQGNDNSVYKEYSINVVCGLSFSRTRRLSRDIPSDAGFLTHKVSVLREMIGNRLCGFVSVIN